MELCKDDMQLLLDFIDIESSKYMTATENKQYWNGTIHGLEIGVLLKSFSLRGYTGNETN